MKTVQELNAILDNSKEVLSVIDKLFELYKPKTREEASEFCGLRYGLPGSVDMLYNIVKMYKSDDDEFFDSVAPLREMAIDVATRITSIGVIIKDIIAMYSEPHDDDSNIYLYLAYLKSISNSVRFMSAKLANLHMETSREWPELETLDCDIDEDEDDDTNENESVLPGEIESFQIMRSILVQALEEYTDEHESERIADFFVAIQDYLESFANGVEPDKEFGFSFARETGNDEHHEIEYLSYHFETEMIQVSSGGSIYDKPIGSDSYTDWIYCIWLNGWDENNHNYRFSTVLELVRNGARLSIECPDEYADSTEDDSSESEMILLTLFSEDEDG